MARQIAFTFAVRQRKGARLLLIGRSGRSSGKKRYEVIKRWVLRCRGRAHTLYRLFCRSVFIYFTGGLGRTGPDPGVL